MNTDLKVNGFTFLHFMSRDECLKHDRYVIRRLIAKIRITDEPRLRKKLDFELKNYRLHQSMKESEF